MAHALQIDTLAFAKKLRAAGADERLADAIVEGITAADTSELATKSDLRDVEHALKADVAMVRSELKEVEQSLRGDLRDVEHALKAELKSLELRMTMRLGGIMAVGIGIIATMDAIF